MRKIMMEVEMHHVEDYVEWNEYGDVAAVVYGADEKDDGLWMLVIE